MMRSDFVKRGALRAVCLIVVMICTIFSSKVQAAEEGGMTQPSSAKIYSSMSEGSDIIANLIVGNVFEVLEAGNDPSGGIWYKIRTDFGAEGYVKAGEMDKLIMDAQALLSPAAPDAGGEGSVPAEENAGEEVASADNADGEEPTPDENADGEEVVQEDNDPGEEPAQNVDGEVQASAEDSAGEVSVSEEAAAPESGTASEADPVEGAGAGKASDSATAGSEGFTVIERTDNSRVHGHGRIDVVLIMIIAGGVLCIIAIAALLKRIVKCAGTEA